MALGIGASLNAQGADWYQWRGPNRDGISEETGWKANWAEGEPQTLWNASLGAGCSAVSVKGDRVFATGNISDKDIVYCLDVNTGETIWKFEYDCLLQPKNFEGGPGTTPTVDGNRVYTLSRMGHLHCLDAETGEVIWSKDAQKEFGSKEPTWGLTASPYALDDKVIVNLDKVIAFNKETGEVLWQTENIGADYSTPSDIVLDGTPYLAVFATVGLVVLDRDSGQELLRYPWTTNHDVNAATPIVRGNEVFISSGYNTGCALLRINEMKPELLWQSKVMRNHFNSCVLYDGYLYGFDEADLKCIEWATGEEKWSQRGLGKASLKIADGKLIIMGERGYAVIAEATPDAYKEISRSKVLNGRCWVVPVLANGRLYCKDNDGELVCLNLRKE